MLQRQQNNKKKKKQQKTTKTIKKWEIKNTFLSHFVNLDAKQIARHGSLLLHVLCICLAVYIVLSHIISSKTMCKQPHPTPLAIARAQHPHRL